MILQRNDVEEKINIEQSDKADTEQTNDTLSYPYEMFKGGGELKEIRVPFKAYTAASPSRKWEGEIIPIQLSEEPYEVEINARGSCFHVLTGNHQYGRYICIPNWNVGTEMASYNDVFWNREHLVQCTKLGKVDASSVACGLAALAEYLKYNTGACEHAHNE